MKIAGAILFVCFCLFPFEICAEDVDQQGLTKTVEDFFIASSNGDVEAIKALIGGPYYERRKVLLNANQEYPKLLRSYSKRGKMRIVEIQKEAGQSTAIVMVENQLNEGQIIPAKLVLSKNQSGEWKIVDEIFE
jgi:hypothetical protein